MEKPKKVRKELSRLQRFLSKEVERMDTFLSDQRDRPSLADSQITPFMPALTERRRLAAADLAQVTVSLARVEAEIARIRKGRKASASPEGAEKHGDGSDAPQPSAAKRSAKAATKPAASTKRKSPGAATLDKGGDAPAGEPTGASVRPRRPVARKAAASTS